MFKYFYWHKTLIKKMFLCFLTPRIYSRERDIDSPLTHSHFQVKNMHSYMFGCSGSKTSLHKLSFYRTQGPFISQKISVLSKSTRDATVTLHPDDVEEGRSSLRFQTSRWLCLFKCSWVMGLYIFSYTSLSTYSVTFHY